jgi:hypothetical protein
MLEAMLIEIIVVAIFDAVALWLTVISVDRDRASALDGICVIVRAMSAIDAVDGSSTGT